MSPDAHSGIVAFGSLSPGRESIMLGRVQVGEIGPAMDPRSRFPLCFRIDLPDAASRAWRPARDLADARRQAVTRIAHWLEAADLRPNGEFYDA